MTLDPEPSATPPRVERFDTVVIGAGQAGLATGYHLARAEADFVILDGAERPGASWRNRWDTLRLFTPAKRSGLPGMPFPAPPEHLPYKDEVADYFERYADRFDLPIRGGVRVDTLRHDGSRFVVNRNGSRIEADQVVVATGAYARLHRPAGSELLDPTIHQLDSTSYRNPFELPEGPVLVVGAGNSGAQIALELSRHRKVWLAGRDTGTMPRRLLGRDIFDWIWPVISRLPLDGRLGHQIRARLTGGDALIGMDNRMILAAGIERVGRFVGANQGMPTCGDRTLEPRVIIWCTGLRPAHGFIELPAFGGNGLPEHRAGSSTAMPGLHFVGLRGQRRITSSLVGGAGADAAVVAAAVVGRERDG